MAKNKRGRAYKLTPRRRAALAKAQRASALARRRRVVAAVGLVGATLAAGGLAYAGRRRSNRPRPSKALLHVPGLGVNHTAASFKKTVIPQGWGKSDLPPQRQIKTTPKTVFKVSSKGTVTRTTKKRMIYDTNRRRSYWQGKPVGGAVRTYNSTKRGRR